MVQAPGCSKENKKGEVGETQMSNRFWGFLPKETPKTCSTGVTFVVASKGLEPKQLKLLLCVFHLF